MVKSVVVQEMFPPEVMVEFVMNRLLSVESKLSPTVMMAFVMLVRSLSGRYVPMLKEAFDRFRFGMCVVWKYPPVVRLELWKNSGSNGLLTYRSLLNVSLASLNSWVDAEFSYMLMSGHEANVSNEFGRSKVVMSNTAVLE